MTQPPGPDESTGPAQQPEPVPPAEPGQQRETAPPEDTTPPAEPPAAPGAAPLAKPVAVPPAESSAAQGAVPSAEPPAVSPPAVPLAGAPGGGAAGAPGIRPPAPEQAGADAAAQPGYPAGTGAAQPGYPAGTGAAAQPGYAGYPAPGAHPAQPGVPQYPAGGYEQPRPGQYDPSQPYMIYQAMPTGGMFHGQIGDGDPLVSPDYSGWWRRSLAIVKQGWRSLAVLQAIGFAVSLLFSVPQALLVLNLTDELNAAGKTVDPDTGAPVMPDLGALFAVLGLSLVGTFLAILVSFVVAIACNHVAVSVAAGLRPRLGAALGLAARRVLPLIGWQILAGLIVLAGICACVLPAIYLSAVFMLLPVVVTFERGGSAISRCFKLFHQDLGASISRIATIAGISIGVGVVAYIINTIIQLAAGTPTFDPQSTNPFGGVNAGYAVALVIGTVVADLMARASAVFTAPLSLAAYADLRGRVEPLTTATLADEAGLAPAVAHYDAQGYGQGPSQGPSQGYGQGPSQGYGQGPTEPGQGPDSDWMPPNR